jgi:hypothetical protein
MELFFRIKKQPGISVPKPPAKADDHSPPAAIAAKTLLL